jgi:hypothetical protein
MATGPHRQPQRPPSRPPSRPYLPPPPEDRLRSGIIVSVAGMALAGMVAWLAFLAP